MEDNFINIINTTYKVLDFFPEGEPLKNRAKDKVLSIVENGTLMFGSHGWVSFKNYLTAQREKAAIQLLDDIEVLETYLKLGKYQGFIDDLNFLILVKEYEKMKEVIKISKSLPIIESSKISSLVIESNSIPEKIVNQIDKSQKSKERAYEYSERQVNILKLLEVKDKLQVADIIKEIPNITKRTIRRDLDELLEMGKIERIGEFNQVFYKKLDRTNNLSYQSV